jgi:hypothetical protein
MAQVLHLWKSGADALLVSDMIAGQRQAGDRITVAVLDGTAPALPSDITVRRLGDDLTYGELVELIFASEHVVPW